MAGTALSGAAAACGHSSSPIPVYQRGLIPGHWPTGCLVSIRAYKKIEEDDLKFPLIYGEGKKVICWDVRGGVPAALGGGGLVASQLGLWHHAGVVPYLPLLNWGSQPIFSNAVMVPMPRVSFLLGEEVKMR